MVKADRSGKTLIAFSAIVLMFLFFFVASVNLALVYADESRPRSNNQGAPRIEVDREYVDYGEVPLEQMVKHRTIIKNVGDAPLVIEDCHAGIIHSKAIEGC